MRPASIRFDQLAARLVPMALAGGLFCFVPLDAKAHEFALGGDAYEDFLAGGMAVLIDLPVMIALISTGILVSMWKREGLPLVWPAFLLAIPAGFVTAALVPVDPVPLLFATAIALGLLAVMAIRPAVRTMAAIVFLAGLLTGWGILAGHAWGEVPPGAYAGIFGLFNLVLATSAAIVSTGLKRLPYGWVEISFRALASWMVAIAMMGWAFLAGQTG
ncbi:hypothetical protein [Hoeflea phototrophica]|jgi:hypothetical protein|nr:hypothetical protein [Hoeflea phototrophica]